MEITPANAMDIEYFTDEQVYRFSTITALHRLGFPLYGDAVLMDVDEQVDVDEIVVAVRKEGVLMMQERAALGGPPAAGLGPMLNATQVAQILIHVFGAVRIANRTTGRYMFFMYDFRYGSFFPHQHAAILEVVDQVLGGYLDPEGDYLFRALSSHSRWFWSVEELPGENPFLQYVVMREFGLFDEDEDGEDEESQLELELHPDDEAYLEEIGRNYFEEDGTDER